MRLGNIDWHTILTKIRLFNRIVIVSKYRHNATSIPSLPFSGVIKISSPKHNLHNSNLRWLLSGNGNVRLSPLDPAGICVYVHIDNIRRQTLFFPDPSQSFSDFGNYKKQACLCTPIS